MLKQLDITWLEVELLLPFGKCVRSIKSLMALLTLSHKAQITPVMNVMEVGALLTQLL